MRIIAGEFRGHPIDSLRSNHTRPTLDQVKEGIFNALGQFFTGETVLDLFAGSGNLGLEAISRGCHQAVFVDSSGQAVKVIKANIRKLRVEERTNVYKMDASKAIPRLQKEGYVFDLVFLDPPYHLEPFGKLLPMLCDYDLIRDHGRVVCETLKETVLEDRYGVLVKQREYIYGSTKVTIFQKEGATSG